MTVNSKHYYSVNKVKQFMFADIEKSLKIAENPHIGTPNFLLALGLCCYTEYWGKLVKGIAQGQSKVCFEEFFRRLGYGYKKLLDDGVNVYWEVRCGLAHSYMIEENARIVINGGDCGIHYDPKSHYRYTFYVRRYFVDFKRAVNEYIKGIDSGSENLELLKKALKNKPELT
jgi:hypothetical protein